MVPTLEDGKRYLIASLGFLALGIIAWVEFAIGRQTQRETWSFLVPLSVYALLVWYATAFGKSSPAPGTNPGLQVTKEVG